jgi:hypothetical protein
MSGSQASAQNIKEPSDPGVRNGAAGAGGPLRGLTPGWSFAHSLANELVRQTVKKNPNEQLTLPDLIEKTKATIERVENLGRVLDFNLPKRCLFCAEGTYEWIKMPFFSREERRTARKKSHEGWAFQSLQAMVRMLFGINVELRP